MNIEDRLDDFTKWFINADLKHIGGKVGDRELRLLRAGFEGGCDYIKNNNLEGELNAIR